MNIGTHFDYNKHIMITSNHKFDLPQNGSPGLYISKYWFRARSNIYIYMALFIFQNVWACMLQRLSFYWSYTLIFKHSSALLILTVLLFDYAAGTMDSPNLNETRVDETIIEKMKDLQIHRREKIYPYSVEDIKFLEILKSKVYI